MSYRNNYEKCDYNYIFIVLSYTNDEICVIFKGLSISAYCYMINYINNYFLNFGTKFLI